MENSAVSAPLETPLRAVHESAHAKMGEYFGTILPARFGDFDAEYRAIRQSAALVDANYRALFVLSGPDRQRYLNAVLSSNVRDLKTGDGIVGLFLTPQGHILAEIETLSTADRILALSHAMVRERTFATLDKFIIMDDVQLEDLTASTGMLDLMGPRASNIISDVARVDLSSMAELSHAEANVGAIPCRVVRRTFAEHPSATVIVSRDHLAQLWENLLGRVRAVGGAPAGLEAVNSIRLETGTAWFGRDYDDKIIPHEAGLELSHISYEKGCYTGQEIVERVRSRGHANRRLTGLQFLDAEAPAAGTKLLVSAESGSGTKEAGYVTSTGFSPTLRRQIGLGYVRREHSAAGTRLDSSGSVAEVIALPVAGQQTRV